MNHARQNRDISDYNTFEVFDDIYKGKPSGDYDELEMPQVDQSRSGFWKFALWLLIIVMISISIHPVLSYALKTPYPLLVIGEQSMYPAFQKNDLVVVAGIINPQTIQEGDVVVYQSGEDETVLTVNRVVSKDERKLTVKGDTDFSQTEEILSSQVIGKVVSSRLPFIGSLAKLVKM